MFRRFTLAAAVAVLTFSVAFSETNTYKVSKIEKSGDNFVLTVTQVRGEFNKDNKAFDWKDEAKKVTVPASTNVTTGFGGGGFGGGVGGKGGAGGFGGKGLKDGFGNEQFQTAPEGGWTITITTADADVKKGEITGASVQGQAKGKGKGKGAQ